MSKKEEKLCLTELLQIKMKPLKIVENINFCLAIVGVTLVLIFVFAYKFRWCSWKNPLNVNVILRNSRI